MFVKDLAKLAVGASMVDQSMQARGSAGGFAEDGHGGVNALDVEDLVVHDAKDVGVTGLEESVGQSLHTRSQDGVFEYGAGFVEILYLFAPGPSVAIGSNNAAWASSSAAVVHLGKDGPYPGDCGTRDLASSSNSFEHAFKYAIIVLGVDVALEVEGVGFWCGLRGWLVETRGEGGSRCEFW